MYETFLQHFHSLCSLWENNFESEFLNKLIVKDVVYQSHPQLELIAMMVEVFVGWDIVAEIIACLPATKQWEPGEREREREREREIKGRRTWG